MTPEPARLRAKPCWQRARFLPGDGPLPASHEFWVQGPPRLRTMTTTWGSGRGETTVLERVPTLRTNLGTRTRAVYVRASCVELLSRGPEDWAPRVWAEQREGQPPLVEARACAPLVPVPAFGAEGVDMEGVLRAAKDALVARALELSGGSLKEAARLLGVKRTTLLEYKKRRAAGIRMRLQMRPGVE